MGSENRRDRWTQPGPDAPAVGRHGPAASKRRRSMPVRLAACCAAFVCLLAVLPAGAGATPRTMYAFGFRQGPIGQYTVADDGTLSGPITSVPARAQYGVMQMAVSPNGRSLYAPTRGTVSQFTVRPDGSLVPMAKPSVPSVGGPAIKLAVSPNGHDVYVTHGGGIDQFSVGSDGALTPLTPAEVPAGDRTWGIAVNPDGRSLYVANEGESLRAQGTISQYSIGADGALKPMSTPTVNAGVNTWDLTVSPDGKHVYATNPITSSISQFTVAADGSLTPMSTPSVASGVGSYGIAVSSDGKDVYANGYSQEGGHNQIAQFSVGSDGMLKPLSPAVVDAAGDYMTEVTYSPYGRHVYGGGVEYTAGPDGALTRTGLIPAGPVDGFASVPAQPATASFTVSSPPAGVPAFLDAEASSVPVGAITSYHWDFGDGTSQTKSYPVAGHVYEKAGKYTTTLEVTNDAHCSGRTVYSGIQMLCTGGTQWKTTRLVTITKPAALSSKPPGSQSALSVVKVGRSGRVAFAFAVPRAGVVTATARATVRRRGRTTGRWSRPQRFVLAHVRRVATGATTMVFRMKPNARGRRVVRRRRNTVVVRLRVRYQPRHGRGRTFNRTVRVPS
jgi:DNA-binding beta-propeller fold protein YncE